MNHAFADARQLGFSCIDVSDGTVTMPHDDKLALIRRARAAGFVVTSEVGAEHLIFEAPQRAQQTDLVLSLGSDVKLGKIAPTDVVGLETLRLGLRSDTLLHLRGCAHGAATPSAAVPAIPPTPTPRPHPLPAPAVHT